MSHLRGDTQTASIDAAMRFVYVGGMADNRVPITIRVKAETAALMRAAAHENHLSLGEYVRQMLAHAVASDFKPRSSV